MEEIDDIQISDKSVEVKIKLYNIKANNIFKHICVMLEEDYKYVFSEACSQNLKNYFYLQEKKNKLLLDYYNKK